MLLIGILGYIGEVEAERLTETTKLGFPIVF